jgi:hypothetical protein
MYTMQVTISWRRKHINGHNQDRVSACAAGLWAVTCRRQKVATCEFACRINSWFSAWQAYRQQRRMGRAAVAPLVQRPAVVVGAERLRQRQIREPGNAAHPMTDASAMIYTPPCDDPQT